MQFLNLTSFLKFLVGFTVLFFFMIYNHSDLLGSCCFYEYLFNCHGVVINEQRVIVKTFYQNQESLAATVKKLRTLFGTIEAPNSWIVQRLVRMFEKTDSVGNVKLSRQIRTKRIDLQVAFVQQNVAISPRKSICQRSQQMCISRSSL